jgi:hypothetical protein
VTNGAPKGVAVTLAATLFVSASAAHAQVPHQWPTSRPSSVRLLAHTTDPRLAEASGAALSSTNPGIVWTIGDSGNPAELIAIDTSGTVVGRFVVVGVTNTDWEAVSVGPCGSQACVYIADTGDNRERRSEVAVHRLVEPRLEAGSVGRIDRIETLRFRYEAGPHDVEAMGVLPSGELLLVTKGRSKGVLAYRLPADAWGSGSAVVATRIDSLAIGADLRTGRVVTDLAIDPAGKRVAVRTYRDVYLFDLTSDGRLVPDRACDILGVEPQGEGITWFGGDRLLLVSERGLFKRGAINELRC